MTSLYDVFKMIVDAVSHEEWEALVVIVILIGLWVWVPVHCLRKALRQARLVMLMRCLPTSKARAVFIGLSEVKGTAQRNPAVYSYLAERECTWFSYCIEEHWRKVEVETYRDSNGNTRTRTVVRTGWTTVDEGTSIYDFRIQDETGSVLVWPEGATVEGTSFLSHRCTPRDPMYYGKGPAGAIPHSTYERRFTEQGIPIGAMLYIIGTTREQEDGIHPEFADADNGDPYLISMNDEESITRRNGIYAKLLPLMGILVLLVPALWSDLPFPDNIYNLKNDLLHQGFWLHAALVYIAVWLPWTFWQWYGEMVAARNRVHQGVAQVEVQLQRRHDLILRLVDVVDAYCRHEQSLLERVSELRAQVKNGQISLVSEAYPELKSQTLFAKLHQELTDTEERLALAREYLNTIGNFYNTCLDTFPAGLILRLLRFPKFHNYE